MHHLRAVNPRRDGFDVYPLLQVVRPNAREKARDGLVVHQVGGEARPVLCEASGAEGRRVMRDVYMVNVNKFSGSVFVKELAFFRSQGGFVKEWGTNWFPVVADSLEDARKKGCAHPSARPYERQAR